jgi:Flp pilus assembly protein TadB
MAAAGGMVGIAAASGLAAVLGLWLTVTGARLAPPRPARRPSRLGAWFRRFEAPPPWRLAVVAGVTLAVLVVTRWPVAAVAAGCAALFGTSSALRTRVADAEKAEALTVWAEMLRDATGTPRGIEGVLVATSAGAPILIRPHIMRLAKRLPYEPLDEALDGLADDLDHPIGDLIVTALRLSARSGGRQIRAVLDDLATVAREEARMHRRVEVARARPRADMRSVLLIMGIFVVFFVVAARRYLEPYGSATGQLVLCLVVACWGLGVWAMARLGRRTPVERFLAEHEAALQ